MLRWLLFFHALLGFHLLPLFLSACLRFMSRSEPLTLTHLAISSATTSLRNSWVVRRLVKVPAEALGWNLARGRDGLSELPKNEKTSPKVMCGAY